MVAAPAGVKRITLTSKKNWWMVELDDDEIEEINTSANSFSSSDTAVSLDDSARARGFALPQKRAGSFAFGGSADKTPTGPEPVEFQVPRHPSSIFSFPVPTSYSAPPKPTMHLTPVANGSASELFKCIVKKPEVVELEINGESQSNASDVTTQFLAELRVYTTVSRHRNIAAFLGCLPAVGMVLEYIEGPTLYDVLRSRSVSLPRARKIDYHDQLLSALVHLHSYGLSHGDLSLLNIHIQRPYQYTSASVPPTPIGGAGMLPDGEGGCDDAHPGTIKLLDFGRSVSASSDFAAPDEEPADPFAHVQSALTAHLHMSGRGLGGAAALAKLGGTLPAAPAPEPRKVEQIHPGTRPFSAPEILRGECTDPLLADAYSFGMILVCLERGTSVDVKPWDQRKDKLPNGFFEGCEVFGERAAEYLRRWDSRRRLVPEDRMVEDY